MNKESTMIKTAERLHASAERDTHFGFSYTVISTLMSHALRRFYSQIDVVGSHNIPAKSGALLVSSHANMAIDAAMIACVRPDQRPVHLWAKSTLFKSWAGSIVRPLHSLSCQVWSLIN